MPEETDKSGLGNPEPENNRELSVDQGPDNLDRQAADLTSKYPELGEAVDKARAVKGEGEPYPLRRVLGETSDPFSRQPESMRSHEEIIIGDLEDIGRSLMKLKNSDPTLDQTSIDRYLKTLGEIHKQLVEKQDVDAKSWLADLREKLKKDNPDKEESQS